MAKIYLATKDDLAAAGIIGEMSGQESYNIMKKDKWTSTEGLTFNDNQRSISGSYTNPVSGSSSTTKTYQPFLKLSVNDFYPYTRLSFDITVSIFGGASLTIGVGASINSYIISKTFNTSATTSHFIDVTLLELPISIGFKAYIPPNTELTWTASNFKFSK